MIVGSKSTSSIPKLEAARPRRNLRKNPSTESQVTFSLPILARSQGTKIRHMKSEKKIGFSNRIADPPASVFHPTPRNNPLQTDSCLIIGSVPRISRSDRFDIPESEKVIREEELDSMKSQLKSMRARKQEVESPTFAIDLPPVKPVDVEPRQDIASTHKEPQMTKLISSTAIMLDQSCISSMGSFIHQL